MVIECFVVGFDDELCPMVSLSSSNLETKVMNFFIQIVRNCTWCAVLVTSLLLRSAATLSDAQNGNN